MFRLHARGLKSTIELFALIHRATTACTVVPCSNFYCFLLFPAAALKKDLFFVVVLSLKRSGGFAILGTNPSEGLHEGSRATSNFQFLLFHFSLRLPLTLHKSFAPTKLLLVKLTSSHLCLYNKHTHI